MNYNELQRHIHGIPHMSAEKGKIIHAFITENSVADILELGFCHGVSSCYMAAALEENGKGELTSVDRCDSYELKPNLEALLSKTKLSSYVRVTRENHTYNWFLKKKIEAQTRDGVCIPCYDFIFVDGAKDFTTNAATFFLAEKLLNDKGWILFDDYAYKFRRADGSIASHAVGYDELMGEDELTESQIAKVFHLCAMQHPQFGNFKIQNEGWAWAQKVKETAIKTIAFEDTTDVKSFLSNGIRAFFRRVLK